MLPFNAFWDASRLHPAIARTLAAQSWWVLRGSNP